MSLRRHLSCLLRFSFFTTNSTTGLDRWFTFLMWWRPSRRSGWMVEWPRGCKDGLTMNPPADCYLRLFSISVLPLGFHTAWTGNKYLEWLFAEIPTSLNTTYPCSWMWILELWGPSPIASLFHPHAVKAKQCSIFPTAMFWLREAFIHNVAKHSSLASWCNHFQSAAHVPAKLAGKVLLSWINIMKLVHTQG